MRSLGPSGTIAAMSSQRDERVLREGLVVLALTLVGFVLRFQGFGRVGLTHFDEGVYALSGLWSVQPGGLAALSPDVVPYAPPGFPFLVGLTYAFVGVSDASAVLPAILCGVATIPVAAWVARRTFGPGAGAASATFAALSLAHAAFSRKALTDAPFLLAWFVAIGLGGRFLERPGLLRALGLGIAVGLAQNVKYNGAVAGLVVIVAALAGAVSSRERRTPTVLRTTFGWGLFAAVVAISIYWPWFRFVETHGGYADLLRHQRNYTGGAASWLPHWRQQLAQVAALSGGPRWSALVWPAAWVAASIAACGGSFFVRNSRWDAARFRVGLLLGAAVMAALPDLGWWVGLVWFARLLFDSRPAARVLGAWWLVLSVLTPFYHPYARLWLPLHGAVWVLLAGVVTTLGPFGARTAGGELDWGALRRNRRMIAEVAFTVACLIAARFHWREDVPWAFTPTDVFAPSDDLRTAVVALTGPTSPIAADPDATLRVLARRPVAFYLALSGKRPFRLAADAGAIISGPNSPAEWALIDGAVYEGRLSDLTARNRHGLQFARSLGWYTRLDPVTLLDVIPESAFLGRPRNPTELILLAPRGR